MLIFSGSDSSDPEKKLKTLEKRVMQLEKRLAALEAQADQALGADPDERKITQYMGRFDRFEAATNKRMENLDKRLDSLGKKIACCGHNGYKASNQERHGDNKQTPISSG